MLYHVDGTPFDDLDAFVADNPGKGFLLVCDRNPKEMLGIPGEKAEHFYLTTYMQDCYPEWIKALGWRMDVGDDGDVTDLGPTAAKARSDFASSDERKKREHVRSARHVHLRGHNMT